MKYKVCLSHVNLAIYPLLKGWLEERFKDRLFVMDRAYSDEPIHIKIVQVSQLYDWVKVNRLKKHYDCYYILLLDEEWVNTSPIAIRLQMQSLLLNPVKKSAFFRSISEAINVLDQQEIALIQVKGKKIISVHKTKMKLNESMEHYMLRRLLHEDIHSESEMMDSLSLFNENEFPNTVCYVQGFIHLDGHPIDENQSVQLICSSFKQEFKGVVPRVYFLPFRRSLIVLFRQVDNICCIKEWEEGRAIFEKIVDRLLKEYRIQIYIGVGSLYNDPLLLHHSFKESKIARALPPYYEVSLRYFEEISKEPDIKKSTEYIEDHFSEEMTAKDVAGHVNLSYSHFIRLFKKETGNTFSEYITFVRLRKAVWMLRYTDKTIEEISDEVGFNTPNYFSSTFKKVIGITPREFRLTKEIIFV
ncbi:helix-turn-helix transcriptional regulator [Bacillus sp. FJAT-42315]|uniref:helix-turn-helix transcriptional regulator n=1 Tax=Bacillus sp. FJAT-42315 TaxID=2014077 RepID=UPI000C230723|nr:AraC family transcriptional regulator [Bacillus sp. FJAT-42315]